MSDRTKKIILWSACGVVGFALVIMLLLIFLLPGIRPQAQSSSVAVSSSSQASSSSEADTRLEDAKSQNSDVVELCIRDRCNTAPRFSCLIQKRRPFPSACRSVLQNNESAAPPFPVGWV